MIVRIFRAQVHAGHETEFEKKFHEVSLPLVKSQQGLISVSIGRPVISSPLEFIMISTWQDEAALRKFVGDNYTRAVIPPVMEQHMAACWVHHYEIM
ncbi:MAG: Antibiotic biosynthesis monooxygenase [Candidatus Nitrotoga sp. SPKER]|nr:MAG: Antibiotic biosynthesis monooxygenase [Candidatus Nitrotoga sp. SPKER]